MLKTVTAGTVGIPLVGTGVAQRNKTGANALKRNLPIDPSQVLEGKRIYRGENVQADDILPVPDISQAAENIGGADIAILRDNPALSKDTLVPALNDGTLVAFTGTKSASALQSMLGINDVSSQEAVREKLQSLDLLVGFNQAAEDIPLTVLEPSLETGTLNTHHYNVPMTNEKLLEKIAKTVKFNELPTWNPHMSDKQSSGGNN